MTEVNKYYWQKTDKSKELKKLRKTLTVPVFSAECGQEHGSLHVLDATGSGGGVSTQGTAIIDNLTAFTIELWIKPLQTNASFMILIKNSSYAFYVDKTGYLIWEQHTNGGMYTRQSTNLVSFGNWNHIVFRYDSPNLLQSIIINGEKENWAVTLNDPVDETTDTLYLGFMQVGATINFYINEIRVWNVARTDEQLLQYKYPPRNTVAANNVDDALILYWKLNNTLVPDVGVVGYTWTIAVTATNRTALNTIEMYPWKYGASFIAAKVDVALSNLCSFKYPIVPPDEDCTNFSLAVSWLPDQSDCAALGQEPIRRFFWTTSGLDVAPSPVIYKGERIGKNFTLEFWNNDGETTIDLETAMILEYSLLTIPQTSVDQTPINTDLVINKLLAENFPFINFPLEFDIQQSY